MHKYNIMNQFNFQQVAHLTVNQLQLVSWWNNCSYWALDTNLTQLIPFFSIVLRGISISILSLLSSTGLSEESASWNCLLSVYNFNDNDIGGLSLALSISLNSLDNQKGALAASTRVSAATVLFTTRRIGFGCYITGDKLTLLSFKKIP